MTAPTNHESKNQQSKQDDELQDRIVDLREQEQQIQRETAERREQEELQARQEEREKADRQREQAEAMGTIGRQAGEGVRKVETGTQDAARGSAMIAATLLPPAMSQPSLLIDATYNGAISVLTFQRDFFKDLLSTGRQAVAGER